ncbi:P-loop containing nucleoside triphosphate hydrolase protein [Dendrothele bispora CBS 962.96]|uniref:P-loop containing nucleoside triphosphate hydrolase protein n=1 Tax=Dendrothele bispora (strain CBS 962.96) TaxID=1314807 RepID=A0A4S8LJM5_DENBC|nr:P-loop containing nucleoside triphosphate hydrolase protein [Dendrothele bispora CBS 962.96]
MNEHQENLSLAAVPSVHVRARDVAAVVKKRSNKNVDLESPDLRNHVLQSVSADFPSGSLCAIMGASGSGKTTLLNVMAHQLPASAGLVLSGTVLYNGSPKLSSVSHAYVPQTDILLPVLTVRETLSYAASLRLPPNLSALERYNLVEEVITELGLKDCADTRVGDGASHGGCSGGERRRVSIGVQLLGNPSVLFCDEPTTGLDATSAYQLMSTLKSLTGKGRTIICSIHQPRHDIFRLFDHLMLLSQGSSLYCGPAPDAIDWFVRLVPGSSEEQSNPADTLVMVAAIDTRSPDVEATSRARHELLRQAWSLESVTRFPPVSYTPDASLIKDDMSTALSAPFLHQTWTLTCRDVCVTSRDYMGLLACWIEAIAMGVICGFTFLDLPKTLSGIRSREAALYSVAGLQSFVILVYEILRLCHKDIKVFDRERREGVIAVLPWILSRRLAHALLEDIAVPFLFSVTFYFMCGFDAIAAQFFKFYAVMLLNQFIVVSFAMFCVSVSRDFAAASTVGNLLYSLMVFSGGFFIQADTLPVYVRWIKWVSYSFYTFGALASNEFTGKFYDCPSGESVLEPDCVQYRGDFILRNLSFSPGWFTVPICALIGFIVVFNLGSIGLLQVKREAGKMAERVGATAGYKEKVKEKAIIDLRERPLVAGYDLELWDIALSLKKLSPKGRWERLSILSNISTRFEAGQVNVILGPSGSGKSSLLNLLSCRLPSTLGYFVTSGTLSVNGAHITPLDLQGSCSYVMQHDNSLFPDLSVREMLHFSAQLRLPCHMSKAQKEERADEVLSAMGLDDCADNLIGNDIVKGISGGERRRVSIAIQLLTEPRILIADEPTSGLDAFTASSILDALAALAKEGRTVIITIHQSRSELFRHFGHLVVLAKGGQVAYSGQAADMISYFSSLGYSCPQDCNPSDWVLDLVSVDLRNADVEYASKCRLERILQSYVPSKPSLEETKLKGSRPMIRKQMAPLWVSFPVLIRRGLVILRRQPNIGVTRVVQVVGLGGIISLFFSPIGRGYQDASVNIVGLIQEILPFYFVGMLQNAALYPTERDMFYQEYTDNAYSLEAFMLAYICFEVPFEIFASLLFSLLGCIAANLRRTIAMYFVVALNCFCIVNCGESLGIVFNTLFSDETGLALNLTGVFMSIAQFMGGLMSVDMPGFLRGVNYISPLKYATANLMGYALRGVQFHCDDSQKLPDGSCIFGTGEDVLKLYGLEDVDEAKMLGALVGVTVIYRLVAYGILKARLSRIGK